MSDMYWIDTCITLTDIGNYRVVSDYDIPKVAYGLLVALKKTLELMCEGLWCHIQK